MSHFPVLVVTDQYPTKRHIAEVLQPFHEFQCTGTEDQYVQDIDITGDVMKEYVNDTVRRLRGPDGKLYSPGEDQFFRDPTPEEAPIVGMGSGYSAKLSWHSRDWSDGRGYRPKVNFVPEGYEMINVPHAQVESVREFVEIWHGYKTVPFGEEPDLEEGHKYGYALLNEQGDVVKVVKRTNPNKKWDWWEVGGRWSNKLQDVDGYKLNQLQMVDLALEDIRADAVEKADFLYDRYEVCLSRFTGSEDPIGEGLVPPSWPEMRERHKDDISKARDLYNDHPVVRGMREMLSDDIGFLQCPIDHFRGGRKAYVERQRKGAFCFFALLKDGVWHQRGNMGMWATVFDEKNDWEDQFAKLIEDIPGSSYLTVVDCHI
jgi:hypothetical protein